MLQSKEFNRENSNTLVITLKNTCSKQEHLEEVMENLAHQSSQGNMHELFDCIKTPLRELKLIILEEGSESFTIFSKKICNHIPKYFMSQ